MLKHPSITEDRIRNSIAAIRRMCHPDRRPVEVAAWHVDGEPVPVADALAAEYVPVEVGDPWGPAWGTTWFRVRGARSRGVGRPRSGGGHAAVQRPARGLHRRRASSTSRASRSGPLTRSATRSRSPARGRGRGLSRSSWRRGPTSAPRRARRRPGRASPAFTLVQAEMTARTARPSPTSTTTCHRRDHASPAGGQPAARGTAVCPERLVEPADPERAETLPAARQALADVLGRKNGDTVHQLTAIGHAHIDTAWLWPLRETHPQVRPHLLHRPRLTWTTTPSTSSAAPRPSSTSG